MPRPIKCRRVEFFPEHTYFLPLGKRKCEVEEIALKIEELEAMRLKDIEGLTQEECAERMQVSRQTFQNIIDNARKNVAIALTQGNAIHICGGHYTSGSCRFKCLSCNQVYDMNCEHYRNVCPSCGSNEVICEKRNRLCHRV
ncbi:DUF134 domain-containing protein [Petroclostridium sp. X23]|uniref:DUF134 domain-containing protein n=1 Tax=Petroclostridium sp. X23 TaxID=3045146 RepID=UPI0024AE576C|nr:DUF134 domain-containing protein [Petroclostridium sp. X23]WHH61101.1 DUF134 domain-containing protein [Petroclostridium sp. X23]